MIEELRYMMRQVQTTLHGFPQMQFIVDKWSTQSADHRSRRRYTAIEKADAQAQAQTRQSSAECRR